MNQHMRPEPVPFYDLGSQRRRLGTWIDEAISRVTSRCLFINGPEVTVLEKALADFCGAKHVVSCASGTDALLMVLMAKEVGPGDAVLCPSFTFCATGEAVALTGATPVFVDVDAATFNMDAGWLRRGIAPAKQRGLKPRAVIPVDLFGQSADHDAIAEIAQAEGLFVLDDAAQGFGASYKGRRIGSLGLATATSFFPTKPLGCFGDGGAIFTDDDKLAETLRSIRVHGQGSDDGLLYEIDASADRVQGFPGSGWRAAGERKALGRCHQPADSRLSRRADAGSRHRGGARRTFFLISPSREYALEAAHARTHLHCRRLYAALAADRIRARHHACRHSRRGARRGCVFRGAAAAQSFSRDLRRGRL